MVCAASCLTSSVNIDYIATANKKTPLSPRQNTKLLLCWCSVCMPCTTLMYFSTTPDCLIQYHRTCICSTFLNKTNRPAALRPVGVPLSRFNNSFPYLHRMTDQLYASSSQMKRLWLALLNSTMFVKAGTVQ